MRDQFKNKNKLQLYVVFRGHSIDSKIHKLPCVCVCVCSVAQSYPTLCGPMDFTHQDSSPWNFPDESTRPGCHFLIKRIFQNQGFYLNLLHWHGGSLLLAPLGKPYQFSSVAQLCPTLWESMNCSTPGLPAAAAKSLQSCLILCNPIDSSPLGSTAPGILQARTLEWVAISYPSPTPGVYSIESVMPSNHLILCRPLLLLPSIFPSIKVFSNESVLRIRWPKYWSFSSSISPSNEYSGLISFRMDWVSLQSKGLSRVFSNTTVLIHEFFSAQLSL